MITNCTQCRPIFRAFTMMMMRSSLGQLLSRPGKLAADCSALFGNPLAPHRLAIRPRGMIAAVLLLVLLWGHPVYGNAASPTLASSSHPADLEVTRRYLARAFEAAKRIEEADLRTSALRDMAAAQARAGQFDAAMETARGIERDDSRSSALRAIAAAQAEAGQIEEINDWIEQLRTPFEIFSANLGLAEGLLKRRQHHAAKGDEDGN